MNRITSFLALSAIVVAGAFAGTAAQASASNITVDFKVHNGDASASMIRSGAPSSSMSGLISPATSIPAGGDDPASGSAVFSAPALLHVGDYVQGSVSYGLAGNPSSDLCTFTITVKRTGATLYNLHFSVAPSGTNCSVPSDANNTDGQFSGTTYGLTWKT